MNPDSLAELTIQEIEYALDAEFSRDLYHGLKQLTIGQLEELRNWAERGGNHVDV